MQVIMQKIKLQM